MEKYEKEQYNVFDLNYIFFHFKIEKIRKSKVAFHEVETVEIENNLKLQTIRSSASLPYEDLISLFLISKSNNKFKSKIFTIFTFIEQNSPGNLQKSDYIFLISIIPFYTYHIV